MHPLASGRSQSLGRGEADLSADNAHTPLLKLPVSSADIQSSGESLSDDEMSKRFPRTDLISDRGAIVCWIILVLVSVYIWKVVLSWIFDLVSLLLT